MTYPGSPLCTAVNALLDQFVDVTVIGIENFVIRVEQLRRAHNDALFAEAQTSELPDSRHESLEPLAAEVVRGLGDLVESAEQLDRKMDEFVVEHEKAVDLLKGLAGLVELVDDQALYTNHRYVDAVAWLTQHEGVTHGS